MNAVAPGIIESGNDRIVFDIDTIHRVWCQSNGPVGRKEVAALVSFLASDDAATLPGRLSR